jgi:inhibitor of KinA
LIVQVLPLGDQGWLVGPDAEGDSLRAAAVLRSAALPGVTDVVQSLRSVAVIAEPLKAGEDLPDRLASVIAGAGSGTLPPGRLREIPCCYEIGPDLAAVAEARGLSADEVVGLHAATEFTVYAIGFCPGFPYLGRLPERLAGLPRRPSPRVRVEPGSVGLAVGWSCIYTAPRPGGWHIVGRTPVSLVDVGDGYFPLRAGDRVRFRPITPREFSELEGQRVAGCE